MWLYKSPIGNIYIKKLSNGLYGMIYNGTVWEACDTPIAEADMFICNARVVPNGICSIQAELMCLAICPNGRKFNRSDRLFRCRDSGGLFCQVCLPYT